MIEIRTIRMDEAHAYLELLCEVFDLEFARAASVFTTEPMFDLSRKWALFDSGRLVTILTTTPLIFGWGRAIGIAGVATRLVDRGRGLAFRLIEHVLRASEERKESAALLFAHDPRLYARVGFEPIDEVVRAAVRPAPAFLAEDAPHWPEPLPYKVVRKKYDHWAAAHSDRLRRDSQRWSFWRWNLRTCEPMGEGYLCVESDQVREAIPDRPAMSWPVLPGVQWFGLKSLTAALGVPIEEPRSELLLMGRRVPAQPQMFMTDQF